MAGNRHDELRAIDALLGARPIARGLEGEEDAFRAAAGERAAGPRPAQQIGRHADDLLLERDGAGKCLSAERVLAEELHESFLRDTQQLVGVMVDVNGDSAFPPGIVVVLHLLQTIFELRPGGSIPGQLRHRAGSSRARYLKKDITNLRSAKPQFQQAARFAAVGMNAN